MTQSYDPAARQRAAEAASYETRRETEAALAARMELGPEYSEHIAAALAERVEQLAALVRETMEGALPLSVPLVVDVKVGDDWESMTPLTREDAIAAEADELPIEAPVAPLAS